MNNLEVFRLPRILSDGMVLQRDLAIKLWGYSAVDEKVTLYFKDKTYEAIGNKEGKWYVTLPAESAGGPYDMRIETSSRAIAIKDILVGDIWICGGQSNMELPVGRVMELSREEVNGYENPWIRTFKPSIQYDFIHTKEDFAEGEWKVLNKENVLEFSAVGYFFARDLYKHYQVPIGLINVALGGTPAEAWVSRESLKDFPLFIEMADEYREEDSIQMALQADEERLRSWDTRVYEKDKGFVEEPTWFNPKCGMEGWSKCQIPGFLNEEVIEAAGGVIWFKKEFEVSEEVLHEEMRILLGTIVDRDSVYINGEKVGETFYRYPPRIYGIPKGLLKGGKNTVVIRVIFNDYIVGFTPDKLYGIQSANHFIDLQGEWFYKVGVETTKLDPQLFLQYKPIGVYNGMIVPLKYMQPKGVIWYQGESNTHEPTHYGALFEKVIQTWRKLFQNETLPFLYVQLANLNPPKLIEVESGWAKVRQAQLETLKLEHVGMSVTIDIGEWNDLHPLNKKTVGERLALIARSQVYGEDIVYSGPLFKEVSRKGNQLILSFAHIGSGMMIKGEQSGGFVISYDGINFVQAGARLEGDQVIIECGSMKMPIEVRYAWADNPKGANLYNKEQLPASPFKAYLNEPR